MQTNNSLLVLPDRIKILLHRCTNYVSTSVLVLFSAGTCLLADWFVAVGLPSDVLLAYLTLRQYNPVIAIIHYSQSHWTTIVIDEIAFEWFYPRRCIHKRKSLGPTIPPLLHHEE